jgi:hypothetical protein
MEDRELLERIDRNTTRNVELTDAMLAILGEILTVLRRMHGHLERLEGVEGHLAELRSLGESHQQALLKILDRLGPAPGAGAA